MLNFFNIYNIISIRKKKKTKWKYKNKYIQKIETRYLEDRNKILSRIILDEKLLKELCVEYNMNLLKAECGIFTQCGIYDPSLAYYYYTFDNIDNNFFNELERKINQLLNE